MTISCRRLQSAIIVSITRENGGSPLRQVEMIGFLSLVVEEKRMKNSQLCRISDARMRKCSFRAIVYDKSPVQSPVPLMFATSCTYPRQNRKLSTVSNVLTAGNEDECLPSDSTQCVDSFATDMGSKLLLRDSFGPPFRAPLPPTSTCCKHTQNHASFDN